MGNDGIGLASRLVYGLGSLWEDGLATVIEGALFVAKSRPCVVVDGSDKAGFKKWKKSTMHPTPVSKTMTAAQLLVCVNTCVFPSTIIMCIKSINYFSVASSTIGANFANNLRNQVYTLDIVKRIGANKLDFT